MNFTRLLFFAKVSAASLCLMLACGCNKPSAAEAPKPAAPPGTMEVAVTQVKRGPITRSINLPATIRARQQVTLYAKVAGYLKSIRVDRGDSVKEGDLIAEVEAPELKAELEQTVASERRSQAEINRAQATYEEAHQAYTRLSSVSQTQHGLIAAQDLDEAKMRDHSAEATLAAAREQALVAQAAVNRLKSLLDYARVLAPFSGVITKRWVDLGALIPAATGSSSPQSAAVVTLMDFSTVRVEAYVPEPETPLIQNGLAAEVKVEELAGKSFTGTVTRFAHALEEATKTMATEIDIANPEGTLRPGMFATVKLAVERKADVLLVPVEALVVEKTTTAVFTVVDGKAKKIPVKPGFQDGKFAEIFDGPVLGATVIMPGKVPLSDGQPVKAREGK